MRRRTLPAPQRPMSVAAHGRPLGTSHRTADAGRSDPRRRRCARRRGRGTHWPERCPQFRARWGHPGPVACRAVLVIGVSGFRAASSRCRGCLCVEVDDSRRAPIRAGAELHGRAVEEQPQLLVLRVAIALLVQFQVAVRLVAAPASSSSLRADQTVNTLSAPSVIFELPATSSFPGAWLSSRALARVRNQVTERRGAWRSRPASARLPSAPSSSPGRPRARRSSSGCR